MTVVQERSCPGYVKIEGALLLSGTVVDFDIHIWPETSEAPVLYRRKTDPFTEDQRERLADSSANVYASVGDHAAYARYLERYLDKIIENPRITTRAKASAVHTGSLKMVQDMLEEPQAPACLKRSESTVRNTVDFILSEKTAFHQLLSITTYDLYTYTHSVNVCTFGITLARDVGLSRKELLEFGMGAIFHDVGKTKVDSGIINKPGALTPEEWGEVKKHPEYGLSIINQSAFSAAAKAIILEHHERLDGSGYPAGKKGHQIHPFAKMTAVVDVFSALTSRRSYKKATDSFSALSTMKAGVGTHFEQKYYEKFVRLLGKPE